MAVVKGKMNSQRFYVLQALLSFEFLFYKRVDVYCMVLSIPLNRIMNNSGMWYDHSLNRGCFTFVLPNILQFVIQILCLWEHLIHDAEEK